VSWFPIRKVAAAAITALVTAPALLAWLAGTSSDLDWRSLLAVVLAAVAPVVVAYLVPPATVPPGGEPVMGDVPLPGDK